VKLPCKQSCFAPPIHFPFLHDGAIFLKEYQSFIGTAREYVWGHGLTWLMTWLCNGLKYISKQDA
jgi:hypothetical protein